MLQAARVIAVAATLLAIGCGGRDEGTFSPYVEFPTGGDSLGSLVIADFNGDELPDIAVTRPRSIVILVNTTVADTTSPSLELFELDTYRAGFDGDAGGLAVGDFNEDGKPDLVLANAVYGFNAGAVSVLLNTTTSGATAPSFANPADFQTLGYHIASVAAGDVNMDGRLDMVTFGADGMISVFLNTGAAGASTPSFADRVDVSRVRHYIYATIAVADFNGDSKPDLAVPSHTEDEMSDLVSILLNTAVAGATTPSFANNLDVKTHDRYLSDSSSVAIGDFNADGKPDLAVANDVSGILSILLNTTAMDAPIPSFASPVDFLVGVGPCAVTVGDIDADGMPDVAVTSSSREQAAWVSVFRNTTVPGGETPRLAPKEDFSMPGEVGDRYPQPNLVAIEDFNGDQKPDLAVASGSVSILLAR